MSGGIVEVWEDFNLEYSLKASFTLPFYSKDCRGWYVKGYGYRSGLKIKCESGKLEYRGCNSWEAKILSGAWFNPMVESKKLGRKSRSIFWQLWEVVPGVSIAIDPWDLKMLFYTVFLSRNTDYYMNTVRWVKNLISQARNEDYIKNLKVERAGSSYQLLQLSKIKTRIDHTIDRVKSRGWNIGSRDTYKNLKEILEIPYVGPKTFYAYTLFSIGITRSTPVDRHLIRIGRILGFLNENIKSPNKTYCKTYDCIFQEDCKIAGECIHSVMVKTFRGLSGWIQTSTFLCGRLGLINMLEKR